MSAETFWGSGRKGTAGRGEMRDSTGTGESIEQRAWLHLNGNSNSLHYGWVNHLVFVYVESTITIPSICKMVFSPTLESDRG